MELASKQFCDHQKLLLTFLFSKISKIDTLSGALIYSLLAEKNEVSYLIRITSNIIFWRALNQRVSLSCVKKSKVCNFQQSEMERKTYQSPNQENSPNIHHRQTPQRSTAQIVRVILLGLICCRNQ